MRKIRATAVCLAVASVVAVLGGCAAPAASDDGTGFGDNTPGPITHYTYYEDLPDGRKMLCTWAQVGNAGGPSCDWDGLYEASKSP